jgi:hypothetical protein
MDSLLIVLHRSDLGVEKGLEFFLWDRTPHFLFLVEESGQR